jgi:hypothetical protein
VAVVGECLLSKCEGRVQEKKKKEEGRKEWGRCKTAFALALQEHKCNNLSYSVLLNKYY